MAVQLQIPHMNTQSNMAERRYSAMFSQCHPLPSVIRKDDAMAKRNLKELNLLDDFLFGTLVSHKEFGEAFCRELLQTIFHRNFGKLKVIPQRQYYGDDTTKHGTRLDVYLEEDNAELEPEALYDLEPENARDKNKRKFLPKRARFYRAIVDGHSLASGTDYGTLKDVYIILILPYDPFGQDRLIYTIRSMCQEDPSMPYDDGARTIFLYTKGTQGDIPRELQELLRYMEDTTSQNAVNPSLRKIQRMVENVKEDKGVLLEYMKIWEWEQQIREEAIEEGREAGRKAGMKAGMEAGRKAGMTAGIEAGKQAATKTLTLNMLSKKKFSYEEIADLVGITTEEVRKIEKEHNLPTA